MSSRLDRSTLETAAEWYADLREAGPESPVHVAHRDWLARDPDHRRAWRRLEKLNQRLNGVPAEIIQPALNKARASRRQVHKLLAVLLLIVGGVMGIWQQTGLHNRLLADYHTGTGQRSQVRLADGSLLELNTDSAVDVRFDEGLREIQLRQGEIQVTTAPDQRVRPFIVTTRQGSIRALGTRFLVRDNGEHSLVGVLEHAVEIRPAATPEHAIRLDAGQQLRFTRQRVEKVEPVANNADAWTRGLLIVSDWPLGQFLEELSRYHAGFLGYDEAVTGLRISGAFNLDDTRIVLENLATTLPVRLRNFTPYWTRVEQR